MKKSILLFAAIIFSCVLCARSGKTGNLKWELSGKTLTVSGTGAMPNYIVDKAPWKKRKFKIEKIIINPGVTSIGSYAFFCCFGLTSVDIPNSVTSIGEKAFDVCKNLTSVNIPNSVTNIGEGAFYDCYRLTSVNIPNSVTSIGKYAFSCCSGLTSVNIPAGVKDIGEGAFGYCSKLKSIRVASDNPEYTDIDGVLFNKARTLLVAYPEGKGGAYTVPTGVTSIGKYAFYGCSGLTSVNIPNSVTSIGKYAFLNCSKLSDITVNWNSPIKISGDPRFKDISASAVLNVPAGTKSLYLQAEGWKKFKNIVEHGTIINDANYAEIDWQLRNNSTVNYKDFNIRACITSESKIDEVNITVNGELYRGTTVVENDDCDYAVNRDITLAEGNNIIRIEAKNAAGSITSERRVDYRSTIIESTEKRYALVIGNATYKENPLKNPVNDAADIADKLRNLNFEVALLTDKNQREMEDAIEDLRIKAKKYDAVMFFYSGHGIQHDNKNYLIPADADLKAESDLKYKCVDVNRVLESMEKAECNIKLIVLDACRNNPYARSWHGESGRGLSSMNVPTGTLIAYSTAPDRVASDGLTGRNSPYTSALLNALDERLPVEALFKRVRAEVTRQTKGQQVPWESTSLIGDFYFKP